VSTAKDPSRIRILSVDDHLLLREGIAAVLDDQPDMTLLGQAAFPHVSRSARRRRTCIGVGARQMRCPGMDASSSPPIPASTVSLGLSGFVASMISRWRIWRCWSD
jgi:hypothetical protein